MLAACLIALAIARQPSPVPDIDLDAQFAPLVEGAAPGFAAGIVREGVLLAEGYYGYAELEHGAPVDADTRFYVGSISKQFTAAIVIQLAMDGRVDLDAPITSYVDGLHEIYADVTVRQLLHHTGGVREYTSLLLIRGDDRRLQDRMSQADAMALITRQRALDFEPGTQQRYSSSGYVLLAAMIEVLEGEPFAAVAARRLFEPLGMTRTLFDSDHGAVVEGRAQAYQRDGEAWRRWLKHFDVVGDGGLLTTLRDMAKWDHELAGGAVFGETWRTAMHTRGRLRDGAPLNTGPGLFFGRQGGRSVVTHGGGLGGYIADQIRFPDEGLSVYVFANRNDGDAFQAWRLADRVAPPIDPAAPEQLDLGATAFDGAQAWVGAYFSDDINNRRFLRLNAAGGLDLHDGGDRFTAHLLPRGQGRFVTHRGGVEVELFDRAMRVDGGHYRYTALAFDNAPPASLDALEPLTGWYCSAELEAQVSYTLEDGHFVQRYAQGLPERLYPAPDNPNAGWNGARRVWTGLTMVRFDAEAGEPARQVVIGDLRVSGVTFERCEGP